jgi:hypothetical protein
MEQDLQVAEAWVAAWVAVKAAAWDEAWVLECKVTWANRLEALRGKWLELQKPRRWVIACACSAV